MAKISVEKKKAEAIERMQYLKLYDEMIKQFDKEGYLSLSEPPLGAFYWVKGKELEAIRKFEKKYDALVYLVVRAYTSIGKMDSYFYVCDDEESWGYDWDDLQSGQALTYTVNYDMPDCSEFGSIGFKRTIGAGLMRVW